MVSVYPHPSNDRLPLREYFIYYFAKYFEFVCYITGVKCKIIFAHILSECDTADMGEGAPKFVSHKLPKMSKRFRV